MSQLQVESNNYKTVKNTLAMPMNVVHGGHEFTLEGHAEESFSTQVADKFFEKYVDTAQDTTHQYGTVYAKEIEDTRVWLANMTGDPDATDQVDIKRYNEKGRIVYEKGPNPLAKPFTIKRELKGGHFKWVGSDGRGLWQKNLPAKILAIPAYRCVPFHPDEAAFMTQRDGLSEEYKGACIISRPPPEFRPDMAWKLSDMRVYARIIDPKMNLGKDEAILANEAKKEAWTETMAKDAIRKEKQLILKRLHFRIFNPQYILPTKREYNELLTGKAEDDITTEELNKILKASENQLKTSKLTELRTPEKK